MSANAGIARAFARARVPLGIGGVVLVVGTAAWALIDRGSDTAIDALTWLLPTGLALIALGFLATVFAPVSGGEPITLASPVTGRWVAFNSPTDKVPSHGTHGFGQSYAVDLLTAPDADAPPPTPAGGAFRAPEDYPSFGQPIHAPADADVVAVVSTVRDHRSRIGSIGTFYFSLEAAVREVRGSRGMLGNHVVLRLADGSHFVLAHLRRGSVTVAPGDRVRTGQVLAQCGNSGNSTEPHLHCQRQDIARSAFAAGLPWTMGPRGIPATGDVTGG
ncbi:M23 family metallopeptidase [Mycetocola reblochoni]|uniref:Possible secreted peptidase n=2 Tax=Mycetocola reblochoni TaxID=331618 RepID=A0A1R4K7Q4_9MICO|nr:M23 family metallopeptidase [Mycetocola reblochoni]RLP71111.1 M23 family metallopeptidase [Mycetocola reblochoni]SJN40142.1 possible secreted peptidase [Mycetocola reblochoni REB411]